jgi:hypothetical protein
VTCASQRASCRGGELVEDGLDVHVHDPAGHMFAGWITFSAAEEDGVTVAQCQVLMRA